MELWNQVLTLNLSSAMACSKCAIPGMKKRGWGRIINISSISAHSGGGPGCSHYAASKAGMIALTQTLAKEVSRKGITVNAIAPGFIATDMLKSVPEDVKDKIISQIPVGRLGAPSEVAGAVSYLASDEGSYITGQVIDINGGLYI